MLKCCCKIFDQGLWGWLIQRVSAVAMLLYFVPLLYFWFCQPQMNHAAWQQLLLNPWMLGLLAINLLAFFIHAYIGLWTVCTDYLHNKYVQSSVLLALSIYMLGFIGWAAFALFF